MESKKGVQMSMEFIVGAIIILCVLIVALFILFGVGKGPLQGIIDANEETEDNAGTVFDSFANIFGKCEDGRTKCSFSRVQRCIDGKWVSDEERCEDGCEDGACR